MSTPPEKLVGTPSKLRKTMSPEAFMRLLLKKVEQRFFHQLNPWSRGIVQSLWDDGTVAVKRTGYDAQDEDHYIPLGAPPIIGDDVYVQKINGGRAVVAGNFDGFANFAKLSKSGSQTIGTGGSETAATFQTLRRVDPITMADLTNHNTKLFSQRNGWYFCSGCIVYVANATGTRISTLYKVPADSSGDVMIGRHEVNANTASTRATVVPVIGYQYLAEGDAVELRAFQTSGGNLDITTSSNNETWMAIDFRCF